MWITLCIRLLQFYEVLCVHDIDANCSNKMVICRFLKIASFRCFKCSIHGQRENIEFSLLNDRYGIEWYNDLPEGRVELIDQWRKERSRGKKRRKLRVETYSERNMSSSFEMRPISSKKCQNLAEP